MTLSITSRCNRTGQLGLAMSSYDMVFHFRPPHDESLQLRPVWLAVADVGAVSAQAGMRGGFSANVMGLLRQGLAAPDALRCALWEEDVWVREQFQLGVVDAAGRTAAFSGPRTMDWSGHQAGDGWVAAGNLLVGAEVIESMGQTFEERADLPLDERLLGALEAGVAAGGDVRGHRGAYLRVTRGNSGSELDIRVYEHARPVQELRRLLRVYREENDFAATALKATDLVRAWLAEPELREYEDLATLEAVGRIRALLAGRHAPPDSLEILDRILSILPERRDVAEQRFGDAMKMIL